MTLDVYAVRSQFPALRLTVEGQPPTVFLDNPGGTQVPQRVLDAMHLYLTQANSNCHGAFLTSERTDATIASARQAMAHLLNPSPREIVSGPNMTTLTFHRPAVETAGHHCKTAPRAVDPAPAGGLGTCCPQLRVAGE